MLVGDDLHKEVQAYLRNLHKAGCPVNTTVTVGVATELVCRKDSNLLAANGGHICKSFFCECLFTTEHAKVLCLESFMIIWYHVGS